MPDRIRSRALRCDKGIAALEFALLAPVLLMLIFGIIVYSIYFTTALGVRQAAAEGARAAVAGLSSAERSDLAQARAQEVIDNYGSLLSAGGVVPVITTLPVGTEAFQVQVSYDMDQSPIMQFGRIVPLPSSTIESSVIVINGSY